MPNKFYTQDDMIKALEDVENTGLSINAASKNIYFKFHFNYFCCVLICMSVTNT